jgi:hypothetical protein
VLRHWRAIAEHLLPGGVVSHRSAFDGRPNEGRLFVTRGKTRRTLALPGLAIEVLPGPGPVTEGSARDVPYGELFLSSEPRRFLENLARGRGWSARVLPQEELEVQLDRMLALRGAPRLNDMRDACKHLADRQGLDAEFKRLAGLVGALLGTHAPAPAWRSVSWRRAYPAGRRQGRPGA